MEKVVKKFDKNLGKFVSTVVEDIELLNINKKLPNSSSRYEQKVFIDEKDIEIINSMKDYIEDFDYKFFDKYKDDINTHLFKEKLYSLDRRIESFLIAKESKDNSLIENAVFNFKQELKGYKALKESILNKLTKFKYDKKQRNKTFIKRFTKFKTERVSRFSHESYGCVLSVSKGRRNSF